MHSVADRISGCIAAVFCCSDKVGKAVGSVMGPVATLTISAAAVSGARMIESSLSGVGSLLAREKPCIQKHAFGRVAAAEIHPTVPSG